MAGAFRPPREVNPASPFATRPGRKDGREGPLDSGMVGGVEQIISFVLTGTRCRTGRIRVLQALADRPRSADQLADVLDMEHRTVRDHLDVLAANDIVTHSGDDYGAVYSPTDRARDHWATVEGILDRADIERVESDRSRHDGRPGLLRTAGEHDSRHPESDDAG